MSASEIQTNVKREHAQEAEATVAGKHYVPATDIFETDDTLTLVMDMPGVTRDRVDITLDRDRLSIQGRIDHARYDGLKPLYTEYNIGHFVRTFSLSRRIDRDSITADMRDGVLTLRLPIAAESKPRRITVE